MRVEASAPRTVDGTASGLFKRSQLSTTTRVAVIRNKKPKRAVVIAELPAAVATDSRITATLTRPAKEDLARGAALRARVMGSAAAGGGGGGGDGGASVSGRSDDGSAGEDPEITLLRTPHVVRDSDTGVVTYTLHVEAGKSATVATEVALEWPRGESVEVVPR